jgi:hypothetical protein
MKLTYHWEVWQAYAELYPEDIEVLSNKKEIADENGNTLTIADGKIMEANVDLLRWEWAEKRKLKWVIISQELFNIFLATQTDSYVERIGTFLSLELLKRQK